MGHPFHSVKLLHKVLLVASIALPCAYGFTQAPELSADEPIAYTADDGILIATGNAVYEDENTRVEADKILYNRIEDQIDASGNVRVTRDGMRLLTEHLVYDADTKRVTAGKFRAGYPPLFLEGDSFEGTLEEIDFSKVTIYFREPVENSPKLEVRTGKWISDESVSGSGLRLNAIGGLKIPLPGFDYAFGSPSADLDARIGFRNSLGAYVRTRWLYPFSQSLSIGGNLDVFSRRGVLVGPAMEWKKPDESLRVFVDTGWIHDHDSDERGVDLIGQRIEQSRGFANFGVDANEEDRIQFKARGNYISDSELYRDFRRDQYFDQFQPDHFLDFTMQEGNLLFNAFARRQINNFYGMVERLPELNVEWLPSQLAQSGIYMQAAGGLTRYRKVDIANLDIPILFPDGPLGLMNSQDPFGNDLIEQIESPYHNRMDGSLTLTRPFVGPLGCSIVLRAGGRWTQYRRSETDTLPSMTEDRWVGELGVDFSRAFSRTYDVDRPDWNMSKLRHVSRIKVQYRWHPGGGDMSEVIPDYDDFVYIARRPVLDLADIDHTDGLREWNVARIGWENTIMAAGSNSEYRDYLSFNLYQDIMFSAEENENELDALYSELDYKPFPWLDLQWRQKLSTEEKETEAAYLRAILHSADLWSLTLQAEYLRGGIEQYELVGNYRLSENLGLIGYWHYDAILDTITRQQYGISRRFGNVWQMETYVAFNNENEREDDFSIGMRVLWLSF